MFWPSSGSSFDFKKAYDSVRREVFYNMWTAVARWLRCCATNRKVAGSIPVGVTGIFIDIKPSDRTMVLRSTQPLTEMSTRSISWG